jgi:hypothetical protein
MSSNITTKNWRRNLALSKRDKSDTNSEGIVVDLDELSAADEKDDFDDPESKRRTRLENDSFAQDMEERKRYALATFWITGLWVLFMAAATAAQMTLSVWDYGLSQASYITLMTSSTATVLGMWGIVGAYLFWRPKH